MPSRVTPPILGRVVFLQQVPDFLQQHFAFRWCCGFGLFLFFEAVDLLDEHEHGGGDNQEIDHRIGKHAVIDGGGAGSLGLGERRGNSVLDLMRAEGVASNQVEVVSYGEERPVCRQTSDACWERNRRVEIVYTAR